VGVSAGAGAVVAAALRALDNGGVVVHAVAPRIAAMTAAVTERRTRAGRNDTRMEGGGESDRK
jgi:hypothetical protein